ncbi:hypothetical protein DEM27_32665 [Metarhizobium album]|uniref:Uncharacterized protein n=1 Tax=Metarhizobium album TaxID=2182425 RepID=A0A2U2DFV5_9HYPH|nr:phage protein Gp37 [Rhizobium album]PWE52154.1 hypothetical protein DEM27_32665 [Rhizobium album]
MTTPATLSQLIEADPIAPVQRAIVASLKTLMPGISIMLHPGKVDISELIAKTVVKAPGVGIGWTKAKRAGISDGHYNVTVDWIAYVVAEAHVVDAKRVEKEVVGLAIGAGLLKILSDDTAWTWGRAGVMPPDGAGELKPLFTIADAAQGTAYYAVTWSQTVFALGQTHFPTVKGTVDLEHAAINYPTAGELAEMDTWLARDPEDVDA